MQHRGQIRERVLQRRVRRAVRIHSGHIQTGRQIEYPCPEEKSAGRGHRQRVQLQGGRRWLVAGRKEIDRVAQLAVFDPGGGTDGTKLLRRLALRGIDGLPARQREGERAADEGLRASEDQRGVV